MDSSTFKRFTASLDNILESLEDVDCTAMGKLKAFIAGEALDLNRTIYLTVCFSVDDDDDDEIPQELMLGKQQLSELSSDSAKIKAMGIFNKVSYIFSQKHFL